MLKLLKVCSFFEIWLILLEKQAVLKVLKLLKTLLKDVENFFSTEFST